MENNTKKVKNIEAIVIVVLVVLLIGVLSFLGIRYFSKQNMSIINNAISNLDDIYNESNNNNKEENKNDELEKVEYSKVNDLIEDLVYEKNPIEKKMDSITYKLDMVLPYFKVKTEVTNQINEEIYKIYTFNTKEYLSKELTQSSSMNTKISYKANMDTTKGIISLEIISEYTDRAATGPDGSATTIYKYDYINDKLIEKKVGEYQAKEEKIDPYANYKDYEWGSTKFGSKDAYIEIKNNKVYVTYYNKTTQVKNISGTPKKVTGNVGGGIMYYYILTQQGKETKVYLLEWTDTTATAELLKGVSKYNIVDFTTANNESVVLRAMYFLTADGKLIDTKGDTFEALNKNFVTSFGTLGFNLYIDNKGYVYYSKKGDANYKTVTNANGNKVKSKEWYGQDGSTGYTAIIITDDNQIIYVDDSYKVSYEKGKIKSISAYSKEYVATLLVTMQDGTNVLKYGVNSTYYDVKKGKYIEIPEGNITESIQMYKRKKQNNEYYSKVMTLNSEEIDTVHSVLSQLQNTSHTIYGEEMYKVVITYKTGVKSELKVYPGSLITVDGKLYSLEGQTIEAFETIARDFEWEDKNISTPSDN